MNFEQQSSEWSDRIANGDVAPEQAFKPGFFTGLTPTAPLRGALSGVLETGSVLAEGLPKLAHALTTFGSRGTYDFGVGYSAETQKAIEKPWMEPLERTSARIADGAREKAKEVMPDPRLTGSAGNLVAGASKVLTEAGLATLASGGNPVGGAIGLGAIQASARYRDFIDQGVNPDAALKASLAEGGFSALGMLAPVSAPAKWLASYSPVRALFTDLATGAASNVGQGVASRYVTHKILEDAGYKDLADQQKPLDGQAMFTDMLAGGGFGGFAYLHQRPELRALARDLGERQSLVMDAAKAAQNQQQVVERAPGVPVDMPSQAAHRTALERATEQLLSGKRVDVAEEAQGATFARQAEDTQPIRDMMLKEFKEAGVFDEQAELEHLDALLGKLQPETPVRPQERETVQMPDEEGTVKPAEEHLEAANTAADEAKDSKPLFDAAVDCAGAIA